MLLRIAISLSIVLLFSPSARSDAALLSGKVMVGDAALAGARVEAVPLTAASLTGDEGVRSAPTSSAGEFALELAPGRYYLLARGRAAFAYYGRNPLSVPEGGVEKINLLAVPDNLPAPDVTAVNFDTGFVGRVTEAGQPVSGAVVMVYTDLSSQLKGLGLLMSQPTGADGYFEIPLSAGTYYLVVRKRSSGMMAGPLRAGDLFGYYPANPVEVQESQLLAVAIPVISVPDKVERYAATLFGNTSISGRILDSTGKPVAGAQAVLYEDPSMLNRPLFVSQKTSADGAFVLSFPDGGTYYLAARDTLGGTPAPGDLYGRYNGTPDHSIKITSGKTLSKIDITVEEVY
jgi:hypothetical protein